MALNPNLAMAWGLSATSLTFSAAFEEATRRFDRYKKLSPLDPHAFFFDGARIALEVLNRDYGTAVEIGRRVGELSPGFATGLRHYLAALGHQGYVGEARLVREKLAALEPDFTVQRFLDRSPFERAADTEHYAEGLRRAGLPEGEGG